MNIAQTVHYQIMQEAMVIAICICIDADWLNFCFENDNLSSAAARANEVRGKKTDGTFAH